jgi:hypothetical protein
MATFRRIMPISLARCATVMYVSAALCCLRAARSTGSAFHP